MLPYLPKFKEANIAREFYFDNYFGILLDDIKDSGKTEYYYIFIVFNLEEDGNARPEPIRCYSAEWNQTEGDSKIYLGSFVDKIQEPFGVYHINYGDYDELKDIDEFFNAGLSLAKTDLKISGELKYKLNENIINEKNIRKKENIIKSYNISEKTFDIKYLSYQKSFDMMEGDQQNGLIGMFDHDFYYEFQTLTSDERKKGLFSMNQRIINRIISSLDH
jgi:hypothetical protein